MPLIHQPRHSPVMNGAVDLAAPGSVLADADGDQGRMTGCPPPQSQLSLHPVQVITALLPVIRWCAQPSSQRRVARVARWRPWVSGVGGPVPGKEAGLPGAAGDQPQCDPPLLAVDTRAAAVGTHSSIAACTVSMCSCSCWDHVRKTWGNDDC